MTNPTVPIARTLRLTTLTSLLALPLLATTTANAQQTAVTSYGVKVLASFDGVNGAGPLGSGFTRDSSGNLFGVTYQGGDSGVNNGLGDGTVYEIAAGSNTITTLATFNGANGSSPDGGVVIDSSGNIFGTTYQGGATFYNNGAGYGTVYEIAAGTNTLTTLSKFYGYDNSGVDPVGTLTLDSSGNLYGTTLYSGSSGNAGYGIDGFGSVFEIAAGTTTVTTLANFNGANGAYPSGGLTVDNNGNLYGTAGSGGSNANGTVFEIAAGSGTITALHTFTGGGDGAGPSGGLTLDSHGNLYGATIAGGAFSSNNNGSGTIFKIAAGTNAFSTVAVFDGTDGANPSTRLTVDGNGNIYGAAGTGGNGYDGTYHSGYGTIFNIAAGSSVINTMLRFDNDSLGRSSSALTSDGGTNLFATAQGGVNGDGVAFELSTIGLVSYIPIPPAEIGYEGTESHYGFKDVASGTWTAPSLDGATQYVYTMSGDSLFTSILAFPTGYSTPFTLIANGQTLGEFTAGDSFDFVKFFGAGVSSFTLAGLDPSEDSTNSSGVPLQLDFDTATADFTVVSNSITGAAAAPEPGSVALLALGGLPLVGALRRRWRASV